MDDEIEKIRKKVEERIAEERGDTGDSSDKKEKFTHEEILELLSFNELGDGLIYVNLFKDKHAFIGQAGEWMYYNGHHWVMDLIDSAHFALADVEEVAVTYENTLWYCLKMLKDANKSMDKNAIAKWQTHVNDLKKRISRLRSNAGRSNCIMFAKTNNKSSLSIVGTEIDRDPWSLPVANGVVNLKTGDLRKGSPNDYFLKASPVEWKGLNEPCPTWEKFVYEIMDNNIEMYDFLRRAFGYGITGLVSEQKFMILYGKGRNGKGILTETIQEIMGGEDSFTSLAGPIQSEMLLDQGKNRNAAGPSPDIMSLRGMRITFASETDEGQRFSAARVKWLSGADMLTGRYPHDKRNINFTPTHFLCLLTNSKPNAPSQDFAFWERLLLVDFPLSFVDRQPQSSKERPVDKTLRSKLQKELPGILAWLVRGCLEWQEIGLDPPLQVREAVSDYRKSEDILGDFLEDFCEVYLENPSIVSTRASELYEAFTLWYKENVHSKREFSQKSFGKIMAERFERVRNGGLYYYFGISVKAEILNRIEELKLK